MTGNIEERNELFEELKEEIKEFGEIKAENGVLPILQYAFMNDLLAKYVELKQYHDKAKHRQI